MKEKETIAQILELNDEEIEKWIEERLIFLEQTTEEDRDVLSIFTVSTRRLNEKKENTEIHGFIPNKTRIKKMMFEKASFRLDDKSIYRTVIDYIRNADEKLITNNNYIMNIIQVAIINYFGYEGTEDRRSALYDSRDDISDEPLSISDFKRNGTAMCIEKSAMAQNILAFLGYDPMLIYGFISTDRGISNSAHSYNCIIRDGKAMLVDFTNPILMDGKYFRPACFPINAEQLADFKKGKAQVQVQHIDYCTRDGEIVPDPIEVVYASEEIDVHYFKERKSTQELGIESLAEQDDTQEKDKVQSDMQEQVRQQEISKGEDLTNE